MTEPRMTNLFLQLGLDATEAAIADFIGKHQIPTDMDLIDAPFWSEGQRQFLAEKKASDGEWTTIVDQLNESLHEDAVRQHMKHQ